MSKRLRGAVFVLALCALACGAAVAQDEGAVRAQLDAAHADLVELRFEQALTKIQTLLGDPRLTRTEKTEALILRAQTHVAFGDLDAVEIDYREILELRPGYVPEPSLTPKKAMARFDKVKKGMIGRLKIELDPPNAVLTVDGEPVTLGEEGVLELPAGVFTLRADREGYDAFDLDVTITPDEEQTVTMQLTANSRSVVLVTEPEGVEVLVDGELAGVTARPATLPGATPQPAELLIENLPLGEHEFELRLPCYRTERRRDILNVDLLDNSPKRYEPVRLQRALSTIMLEGGPDGAEVTVDGASIGRLPVDPYEICPGSHTVAVHRRARKLWSVTREFTGGAASRLVVTSRPNAVVLARAWPAELGALREDYNVELQPLPAGADLGTVEGWRRVGLADDVDLAIAVVPSGRIGGGDAWYVYSPILGAAEARGPIRDELDRPDWKTTGWGVWTADTAVGGVGRVVELAEGSAAKDAGLRVGDRIVSVDGHRITTSAELARALETARTERRPSVELGWIDAEEQRRQGTLAALVSPFLSGPSGSVTTDAVRAAWGVAEVLSGEQPAALANLALLFAAYGRPDSAVDTWRSVRWGGRRGVGEGTVAYFLGHALVQAGDEAAAIEAYRRAAGSEATAWTDFGPAVAPAARDCLADLGVSR